MSALRPLKGAAQLLLLSRLQNVRQAWRATILPLGFLIIVKLEDPHSISSGLIYIM